MGKKFFGLVLIVAVLMAALPVQAQSVWGGGSLSIGIRENKDHAGLTNFVSEIYYSEDGSKPVGGTPCFVQEGNDQRPALPNHVPGHPGKIWLLIKSSVLNAGEIRSVELAFKGNNQGGHIVVPGELSRSQVDFWVDMSQFQCGSYPMELKVTHMGGEVTYHVLVFLFRSQKEVTDQTVMHLTVYDPERAYSQAEIQLSRYLRGYEPPNAAKAYRLNTNQDMPVIQAPVQTALNGASGGGGGSGPGEPGTIVIDVYDDPMRVRRAIGRFDLKNEQGMIIAGQAGDRITFTVPPGTYRVLGYGDWAIRGRDSTVMVVPGGQNTINVYKKGGAR